MVVFLGIRPGQINVSGVRDPKDFPQTSGVKGIKTLGQGLGDGPCLAPIEQDWEDVSPVEVHLGSCVNMGPPDILFKEAVGLHCYRQVPVTSLDNLESHVLPQKH